MQACGITKFSETGLSDIAVVSVLFVSIYTLSDLGVSSNLIGSLHVSLANEHHSPPTE